MHEPSVLPRLPLRARLAAFGRDEAGTVVAEAVIILPLFIWAYIALFAYWDSFRSLNTVQKAAFTVSDMISREQASLSQNYIEGMGQLLDYLIDEDQDAQMRVTSLTWSATNNRFEVYWSASPGNKMAPLTTATLQDLANKIPAMSVGDNAVIVEVNVPYHPGFDIGLPDTTFHQFVVTRPRFNCISMDNAPCQANA